MNTLLQIIRLCLLSAFCAACLFWSASVVAQPLPLKACRIAGIRHEVRCGSLRRPLDPAQATKRQIDIHFAVIPALSRRKLPDPVFFLAGGPGQSAIALAPMVMPLLTRLNNRRDIVFVDQRGTGRSAPLDCPDDAQTSLAKQMDAQEREARLRDCLVKLQALPYGDLRYFSTHLAMQDLEAVRVALAATQINLVGGSYGTRAALEYMRQFPKAVRRVVIDGVAPPDMALPASASRDNQAVLDAVFSACTRETRCAKAFPSLRADVTALLGRLPEQVSLRDPVTGVAQEVMLTRDMMLSAIRAPLYAPSVVAALPYALAEAAAGRFDALIGLNSMQDPKGPGRIAVGMHFSVLCAEDMPRLSGTQEAPAGDFGDAFRRDYERACAFWPRAQVPAAFYQVPKSSAAVLVLSGGLDPVTPPRHGERVARALGARARHVVVEHAGHGVLGLPCMTDVLMRFIDAEDEKTASEVDARCVLQVPRPPAFMPIQRPAASAP